VNHHPHLLHPARPAHPEEEMNEDNQDDEGDEMVENNLCEEGDVASSDVEDGQASETEAAAIDDTYHRVIPSLSKLAASICVEMRSNSAVTGAVLSRVFDYLGSAFELLVNDLKLEVQSVMQDSDVNQDIQQKVLDKFAATNPFENLDSINKSLRQITRHFDFVAPQEIQLEERLEMFKNRRGERVPGMIRSTFQYVSILQVIQLVLSNDIIRFMLLKMRQMPLMVF